MGHASKRWDKLGHHGSRLILTPSGASPPGPAVLSPGGRLRERNDVEVTVKIELNSNEIQTLGALIDVAVKASGIAAAKAAVPIYDKLEKAVAEFNAANEQLKEPTDVE